VAPPWCCLPGLIDHIKDRQSSDHPNDDGIGGEHFSIVVGMPRMSNHLEPVIVFGD
jgi:hypothetical protein